MQPLFATARRQAKNAPHGHAQPTLDLDKDIFPLPLDQRAAAASERLLELRRRYPRDSLWRSVFRLGASVRMWVLGVGDG